MTPPGEFVWRSKCGRGGIVERRGLFWCYVDLEHVGTQLHLEAAKKLVLRKLEAKE